MDNNKIKVDSVINDRVTGISFDNGQTLLKIGNQKVPVSSVLELNESQTSLSEEA